MTGMLEKVLTGAVILKEADDQTKEAAESGGFFQWINDHLLLCIGIASGIVLILAGVLVWLILSRKKKKAELKTVTKAEEQPEEDAIFDDETVVLPREEAGGIYVELVPVKHPGDSYPYVIRKKAVVGRADKCDIIIPDIQVSREHFLLEWNGESLYITDLGTTNGTRLNGAMLSHKRRVESGDRIEAGKLELVIRW